MASGNRIINVHLDERTTVRRSAQVEHERRAAVEDLLDDNSFVPAGGHEGPFVLHLLADKGRLTFDVRDEDDAPLTSFDLSLKVFRSIVKDYFIVCDSYYKAIKTMTPSQIEAIDMGRRGLHNEGARLLRDRLDGKAEIDEDTARRLFTLVCVLHLGPGWAP